MFERFKEYLKFGAGRPPGTMWAMEKSYFEWKHKYPARTEYAYLRLALQSRYPLNNGIPAIADRCRNLDDAILEAVRLDFGDFVVQMFEPALKAFPPCSACGHHRALSTVDTLCYGCRNFGDLIPCHKCRLWWKRDSKFCQKCGGPLAAGAMGIEGPDMEMESSAQGNIGFGVEGPSDTGVRAFGWPQQSRESRGPRFDYTEEELFRFGITYLVLGRWEKLVGSEEQARDCVIAVVKQLQGAGCKRRELIRHVYFPLQVLLMARGQGDFSSVQYEPAFSKVSQKNFALLYDAFSSGGEAAFRAEWKRIFASPENLVDDPRNVATFSGGPGFTKTAAVLITGPDPETIVTGEYWYLAYSYGRMGTEWSPYMQALIKRDQEGKLYDLLEIELADGTHLRIYFDISHLPY